jgi:hypothetical protein
MRSNEVSNFAQFSRWFSQKGKSSCLLEIVWNMATKETSDNQLLSFARSLRMTTSWFRSLDLPDKRLWRDLNCARSGLPSDRHPDRPSGAILLEDVTVWLAIGTEERTFRSNKETDEGKSCAPLHKLLD